MSEVGATAAQRYREELRSKAARMGGGSDARSVDASDFTPGEPLDAEAKTGMRPVSRQARRDGGTVSGAHAAATPGRAARKSGGGFGESFANRDQKEANEDRAGIKHDMGLRAGGAAHRARGGRKTFDVKGFNSAKDFDKAVAEWNERNKHVENPFEAERRGVKPPSVFSEPDEGKKHGGAAHRADGGGVYKPDIESAPSELRKLKRESASGTVKTRVGRAVGGPLSTPLAAGMGGQGRMDFNFANDRSQMLADGGKAHERYGHGPSCNCPSCRSHKADGGKVASGALKQHRDEHQAMGIKKGRGGPLSEQPFGPRTQYSYQGVSRRTGKTYPESMRFNQRENAERLSDEANKPTRRGKPGPIHYSVKEHPGSLEPEEGFGHKDGGRAGRARGGRSGKGKTNINIIIGSGAHQQPPAAPPPGMNPQLAIRPPVPPMPPPGLPPPGAGPPMGAPMGAGPPPGLPPPGLMPPRARGGRAPKIEAGAGSGLGRLEKIKAYGKRSYEVEK